MFLIYWIEIMKKNNSKHFFYSLFLSSFQFVVEFKRALEFPLNQWIKRPKCRKNHQKKLPQIYFLRLLLMTTMYTRRKKNRDWIKWMMLVEYLFGIKWNELTESNVNDSKRINEIIRLKTMNANEKKKRKRIWAFTNCCWSLHLTEIFLSHTYMQKKLICNCCHAFSLSLHVLMVECVKVKEERKNARFGILEKFRDVKLPYTDHMSSKYIHNK